MLNVQRTIKQFIAAGAKGCTLEDQKWPKKSGSVRGKEVIGMDEHIAKVSYHAVLFSNKRRHFSGETKLSSGKTSCAREQQALDTADCKSCDTLTTSKFTFNGTAGGCCKGGNR